MSVFLLWLGLIVSSTGSGEMPEVLWLEGREYPTYVAADLAIDAEGNLNASALHPHDLSSLRNFLQDDQLLDEERGCIHLTEFYDSWNSPRDMSTFPKAVQGSELIVHARVSDTAVGFLGPSPGTLYALEILDVLRGKLDEGPYFTFIPVGEFEAGPYRFCKSDSRFPPGPEVGDEAVLLLPWAVEPSERLLPLPDDHGLVVFYQNGAVGWMSGHGPGQEGATHTFGNVQGPEEGQALQRAVLETVQRHAKNRGR